MAMPNDIGLLDFYRREASRDETCKHGTGTIMVKRWVMATLLSMALIVSVVGAAVGEASASTISSRKTLCIPVYATGIGQDFGTYTTANISVGPV